MPVLLFLALQSSEQNNDISFLSVILAPLELLQLILVKAEKIIKMVARVICQI